MQLRVPTATLRTPKGTVEITDAQVDDAEDLLHLHQEIVAEEFFFQSIVEDNQRDLSLEQAIINNIQLGDYIGLIARCNNEIVGSLYLMGGKLIRTCHVVELEMKVTKSFRGLGIGKRLLKIGIYRAKQKRHISKIKLSAIDHNQSAIQLYQNFGFEKEGVLRNELREITGEYRNVICMGMVV
jgi:RimJ/RimL family protein N-acetyltransferase